MAAPEPAIPQDPRVQQVIKATMANKETIGWTPPPPNTLAPAATALTIGDDAAGRRGRGRCSQVTHPPQDYRGRPRAWCNDAHLGVGAEAVQRCTLEIRRAHQR